MTFAATRISVVGMHGEQKEQHAEDILALRCPGNRLHIDRVQGKQRGHQKTWPARSGRPEQEQEKKNRIRRVQQEIGVVMASRIQVKELVVQGMRKPG